MKGKQRVKTGLCARVCVFRRGASRSPPNLVAKQQPCRVAAETEVMSPKMRENTFARYKDAQALSHTCVQSHTHRYSIPKTLLPALKEKNANSCLVLTFVSQQKIKSDGNSELTFTVSLRAVNSPLFEMRLSLRHLHTHTLIHTVTHTQRCVGQVLMAGCGAGSSWWRETCRDSNKNRSEGRQKGIQVEL